MASDKPPPMSKASDKPPVTPISSDKPHLKSTSLDKSPLKCTKSSDKPCLMLEHQNATRVPCNCRSRCNEPQTCEFIQILNVNQSHWLTVSNIGCGSSSIKVYNSLGGRLPKTTKKVIADILECQKRSIAVIYEDVQQQEESSDCGCFALAYATTLCHGQNPSQIKYDQKAMRNHLFQGLDTGELIEFPTVGQRSPNKPVTQRVHVYCICRLTNDGSEMIQCSICDEWFHTRSLEEADWTCRKCT